MRDHPQSRLPKNRRLAKLERKQKVKVKIQKSKVLIVCVSTILLISGSACSISKPSTQSASAPKTEWFKVDPSIAGSVAGKVIFEGKKPGPNKVDMDLEPVCANLHQRSVIDKNVIVNSNGTLANVFIYIKQGLEGKKFEPPSDPVVIDQKGCWFYPRVLGIQVGQNLKVMNSDPLTHNVHPLAQINLEWNQSQSPGATPLTRRFAEPETMIRVKCNIHPWMHAWIGSVAHPYFAVTGEDGSFLLRNVPPGTYTVEAWQEKFGRQEQQITLAPSGKGEIIFKF